MTRVDARLLESVLGFAWENVGAETEPRKESREQPRKIDTKEESRNNNN